MERKKDIEAKEWYKLRNPVRIIINAVVCEVCKYLPIKLKNFLYRRIGVKIGSNSVISPHVQIDPFFPDKITIGDDVVVGWGTKILTHEYVKGGYIVGEVEIKDNVLVGHSSSTRPETIIEDSATVAAHSFVNRDIKKGETVGGVPVKEIDVRTHK